MPAYRDTGPTRILIILFFVLALAYAGYEGRGLLLGPRISITSATSATSTSFIHISGHADRISSLSLNGKEIPVTEGGAFEEGYLLAPGVNRLILDAKDRYGREDQQIVEVVYTPQASATATSTPTTLETTTAAASSSASSTPIAPAP